MRRHLLKLRLPGELHWLWQQMRPYFGQSLVSFGCTAVGVLLGLCNPLILKWFIDRALPRRDSSWVIGLAVLLFVTYEARTLLASVGAYFTLSAAQGMAMRLRMRILRHLDRLSADYYETTPVGAALYPLREPIEEIAYFGSDILPALLRVVLMTCFTVVVMLMLSVKLAVTVFPLLPIFVIGRRHFRDRLKLVADAAQTARLAWNEFVEEHVPAIVQLQLLRRERNQERTAFRLLATGVRLQKGLFWTGSYFTLFNSLFLVLAMSWVLGYGGWLVLSGTLTVGSLIAFYGVVIQLFDPLSSGAELYARLQKTYASIRQVQLVLTSSPSITNCESAVGFEERDTWDIEVDSVEFGYKGHHATLWIDNLTIETGAQIAVTGENGAGKSTLGKLIARLYDVSAGTIKIGGQDIRNVRLESLRHSVAYIPRDPPLFGTSLIENVRFGKASASPEELETVVEIVGLAGGAWATATRVEQGVGPRGCQLSGGQRQRLALARALLARPRILVLDEATSCLDPASEERILRKIRTHLPTATIVVISHRLSTIAQFGRIVILSGGRIGFDGSTARFMLLHGGQQRLDPFAGVSKLNSPEIPPRT